MDVAEKIIWIYKFNWNYSSNQNDLVAGQIVGTHGLVRFGLNRLINQRISYSSLLFDNAGQGGLVIDPIIATIMPLLIILDIPVSHYNVLQNYQIL